MVAGSPVCVQSPARKKLRHSVFAPGRFASCRGLAANVARFSFTICQGGKSAGRPVKAETSRHNCAAKFLARLAGQVVRPADCNRQSAGKCKDPFGRSADHAENLREGRRKRHAEMRIENGPEFIGRIETGNERCGDPRRYGEDDGILILHGNLTVAEIERSGAATMQSDPAKPAAEHGSAASRLDIGQRRIDERCRKPLRHERPASFSALGQCVSDDGARKPRRALSWVRVERGQEQGLPKPSI